MTPEQQAAMLNARVACALIEMEGMKAENARRQSLGHSLAYGEEVFEALIVKHGIHHNAVHSLIQP